MSPSRDSAVLQLVHAHRREAEEGHKRLRVDWREHEEQILGLQAAVQQHELKIASLANASPDVSKLRLTPGMVIAIVLSAGSIIASQQASTWGIKSDVQDIRATQKLEEERAANLKSLMDTFGRKQELQQIQIQELREAVLGTHPQQSRR